MINLQLNVWEVFSGFKFYLNIMVEWKVQCVSLSTQYILLTIFPYIFKLHFLLYAKIFFDTVFIILKSMYIWMFTLWITANSDECVHRTVSQSTRSFPLQRLSPSEVSSLSFIYSFVAGWICQFEQAKLGDWGKVGSEKEGVWRGKKKEWGLEDIKIVTVIHLTQAVEWEQSGLSNLCANSE